jgi:hypothetical protein
MQYDLGPQGLALLLALGLVMSGVVWLLDRHGSPWTWVAAGVGAVTGALITSEAIWAGAEVQPIIEGLSVDEALLGALIGGVVGGIAVRLVRARRRPAGSLTT